MVRLMCAVVLAVLFGLGGSRTQASTPIPTVLGKGPEVHVVPSFGPVGTQVTVVGLGYRSGAHERIVYGPPNAEFNQQPLAQSIAGSRGRFFTSFIVTRPLLLGQRVRPLILGGFEIGSTSQSGAATTAFIVTTG